MNIFPRTLLAVSAILTLAVSAASAQIDTSLLGFRERPNRWTEQNVFSAPLTFSPASSSSLETLGFLIGGTDSSAASFGLRTYLHTFANNGTYKDNVMYFGYNVQNEPGEPMLMQSLESKYYASNQWVSEFHFEGRGINANSTRRWESSTFNRETGVGIDKGFAYDLFYLANGTVGTPMQFWFRTDEQSNSFNSESGTLILHTNNVPFLRQRNSAGSTFIDLVRLGDDDWIYLGSRGAVSEAHRPAGISLVAKQACLSIDGMNNRYAINGDPSSADSLLLVVGGAHFTGGVRTASSFGSDSLTAATTGYVDTRLGEAEAAVPRAISDTLDANSRAFATQSWVDTKGFITNNTESDPLAAQMISDTLDANARGYVTHETEIDPIFSVNGLKYADTTQAIYGQPHAWSQAQRYETTQNGGLLDEMYTSEDSTLLVHRGYIDSRIAGGFVGPLQLADSLDVNAREFVTRADLSDTLDMNTRMTVRGPHALAGTVIDWRVAEVFTDTLSANTSYDFANVQNGKTIVVAVTNAPGDFSVSWPASVRWPGGAAPAQTKGGKTDIYTFIAIGPFLYGSAVQDFDN